MILIVVEVRSIHREYVSMIFVVVFNIYYYNDKEDKVG